MNTLDRLNSINNEIDLGYIYQDDMTFNELEEAVQQWITEQEIIYYSNAIDYLQRNDPSLNEVMEIASDMGYETSSLNSELLATLLHQQNLQVEWADICNEVEEIIEEAELEELED